MFKLYSLEHSVFRLLEAVVSSRSPKRRIALGEAVGNLWRLLDVRHRRMAGNNVSLAFPDWPQAKVDAVVRANFKHIGRTGAEFLGLASMTRDELLEMYRFEGLEILNGVMAKGRGALILTAHLGNWELNGLAGAELGHPCFAVARRLSNPQTDASVRELRERFGLKIIPHRNAVKPILKALGQGAAVCFLMDQRARSREALPSKFFGRRAATNSGLATIAVRTGVPVVPAFGEALSEGHLLRFCEPMEVPKRNTAHESIQAMTEEFDLIIEQTVRRIPEQWFWVHDRWRLPEGMVR